MRYAEAVRHLEELGLGVGPVAYKRAQVRQAAPSRQNVPILVVKNGAMSKTLERMIRQSRAEARKRR